jgi:hypothetical protein
MVRANRPQSANTKSSVEQSVKAQFAKVFQSADWKLFKRTADALFREAAFIKTRDMRFATTDRLLARNARKRLLIGVGAELLLKAIFLKEGFSINRTRSDAVALKFPFRLDEADAASLDKTKTYTLGNLIDQLPKVIPLNNRAAVLNGLRIAMVFRNKEGHIVAASHKFDAGNYTEVGTALVALYAQAFREILTVRFSLKPREKAVWRALRAKSETHDRLAPDPVFGEMKEGAGRLACGK